MSPGRHYRRSRCHPRRIAHIEYSGQQAQPICGLDRHRAPGLLAAVVGPFPIRGAHHLHAQHIERVVDPLLGRHIGVVPARIEADALPVERGDPAAAIDALRDESPDVAASIEDIMESRGNGNGGNGHGKERHEATSS